MSSGVCGGAMLQGPGKAYARCSVCRRIDFEKYEGDRCTRARRQAERGRQRFACVDCGLRVEGRVLDGKVYPYDRSGSDPRATVQPCRCASCCEARGQPIA